MLRTLCRQVGNVLHVLFLIVLYGTSADFAVAYDVNGDGREGLAETVHSLQVVAGLIPASSSFVFVGSNEITAIDNGKALLETLDDISDASDIKPYVIVIEPGIYDIQDVSLVMKPYVHIMGAGQSATTITGEISDDGIPTFSGTVVLNDNANLSRLTIQNTNTANTSIALLAPGGVAEVTVSDVTAEAIGAADRNYGIVVEGVSDGPTLILLENVNGLAENAATENGGLVNYGLSILTVRGGTFTGRGGNDAYGIENVDTGAELIAENVFSLAENGENNFGLGNREHAVATLIGGSFTARGGTNARAIYNYLDSELVANSVTAQAMDASVFNFGLENREATASLNGGILRAINGTEAYAIQNRDASTELSAVGVTASAEGASSWSAGFWNRDEASASLQGGFFSGKAGGLTAIGIYNGSSGALKASNVAALGEDGGSTSFGFWNSDASAVLSGGSFNGKGTGSNAIGAANFDGAYLEAINISAIGEGTGEKNVGLDITAIDTALAYSAVEVQGGSFIGKGGTIQSIGVEISGDGSSFSAFGIGIFAEGIGENIGLHSPDQGHSFLTQSTILASTRTIDAALPSGPVRIVGSSLEGGIPLGTGGTIGCTAITYAGGFYSSTCP